MSWEKQFDKQFSIYPNFCSDKNNKYFKSLKSDIKQFIKDLRQKDRDELIKKFDGVEEYQKTIREYYN